MNGTKRLLVGTVLAIQNTSFTYPACPDCFSRLIHTSSRYQCHRCGGTCKAATHRYKLCVKVAEDQKLHTITLFGRCLEKVFGTSADSLHRHLLGSALLPAPLESGRAQELLLQAAEYCLIGRSLIFSVKIPGDLARGDSVSPSDSLRNIVACQIILPNNDPIGCTILNHFTRLAESGLRNGLTNIGADISDDATLSDSSDLGFSDGSYSLSQSRNLFAEYWQQSLGLSPSSQVGTSAKSTLCEDGQCQCNGPEQLSCPEEHKSQENTVSVQRQINPPDDLLATTVCSIRCRSTATSNGIRHSSLKAPKTPSSICTCKPQSASHVHSPRFKWSMDFGQESYLQNICNSGGCSSRGGSAGGVELLPRNVEAAETHQEQDGTWEDFPFSESLSKIIAGIENGESPVSPLCFTENELYFTTEMEGSCGKRLRARSDCIEPPDVLLQLSAEKSEHGTVMECTAQYDLDESDCSKTLVLNHSISPSSSFHRSVENSHVPDSVPRDSRSSSPARQGSSVTLQCTCSTQVGNGVYGCTEVKGDFEMSKVSHHPITNINTCVIPLGEGSSSDLGGSIISQAWEDVDLVAVSINNLKGRARDSDVYNASSDLFDTNNNTEGTLAVVPHPQCTELLERRENQINKRYLECTLHDSPCTGVIPYCRRPSHANTSYVFENHDIADKGRHFVPYLQSTPVLRRLSGVNCLTGKRWLCNNTSNAKSSFLSIRRKSYGSVTEFLLKKTRPSSSGRRATMFCAVADSFPLLYSPVSASFPDSQVLRLRTLKRRSTISVCKSTGRKRILANKENCGVQGYPIRPHNETGRTMTKLDCTNASSRRDEVDKYCHNALDNVVNLSPVVCSSQQPEFQISPIQTHLPSGWSPELFPENSNVCRQSDDLQRRLF